MGDKRLFDYDADTGTMITFENTDEGFNLIYSQDVEPILESNKIKQGMGRSYYAKDKDMWRVASIPITIQMEWLTKFGIDLYKAEHWDGVRKLLNHPDYRYLKTAEVII